MSRYDDIINNKYEGSTTRKRMSPTNRAAQFAPFAALTGHDDAIKETARLTCEKYLALDDKHHQLHKSKEFSLTRKFFFVNLLVILMSVFPARAQFRVVDAKTHRPIQGAFVMNSEIYHCRF